MIAKPVRVEEAGPDYWMLVSADNVIICRSTQKAYLDEIAAALNATEKVLSPTECPIHRTVKLVDAGDRMICPADGCPVCYEKEG